jgi:hypothetical protein
MFKETTHDVLIGIALIVVSFLMLVVCAAPLYGVFWLLSKAFGFVTTRTGIPTDVWYLALICFVALISSVRNLRNRYWLNLLLSLATAPMAAAIWLKSGLSPNNLFWILPLWLLIATPDSRPVPLSQFVSGCLLVAVSFLLNIGLLGHASRARATDDIVVLATCAWLYFYFFRSQLKQQTDSNAAPAQ